MKLFSIYYRHKRGGFNRRLYRLYQGLAEGGHRLHYLALEPLPVVHPNIVRHRLRVPVRRRENGLFWAMFLLWAPLACFEIIRRHRIDKIVVFSSFYAFVCIAAARILNRPMITFLRADVTAEARLEGKSLLRGRLLRIFETIGLSGTARVITASETLRRKVQQRCSHVQTVTLPNDVAPAAVLSEQRKADVRGRYGIETTTFLIATAAPLSPVKNIGFLIRAFAEAAPAKARLIVIGDDLRDSGERRRLERLAAAIAPDPGVIFTGWLEDPLPVIGSSDLFVFPSAQEGSPNALLEALGCSIPCLGSRIPEIIEVLGYDELLFSIASIEELVAKLTRAAADRAFRSRLAELSAERRDHFHFDWESAAVGLVVSTPPAG